MPFQEDDDNDLPKTPGVNKKPSFGDLSNAMDMPDPRNRSMEEVNLHLSFKADRNMADIGTRYEHLSDLLVMWEDTVDMMARRTFLGRDELFKKAGIELAIKQLRKTMENTEGYYDFVRSLREMLNQIPKAHAIFGGRGKPLKPWEPGQDDPPSHDEMT